GTASQPESAPAVSQAAESSPSSSPSADEPPQPTTAPVRPESELDRPEAHQSGAASPSTQPQSPASAPIASPGQGVVEQLRRWLGIKKEETSEKREPDDKEAAAWLAYSDNVRGGAGFIPWTAFQHPQLGAVEIGGFAPFFRTTPPEAELPPLIDRHLAFVLDLAGRFPAIEFMETKVKALAPGVFEIETLLVNSGYFPSATAMGVQNRRVRPAVVTLDLPLARIIGGERVQKIWQLVGSGGRKKFRWVVRGTAGESINVKVISEKLGDFSLAIAMPEGE
ncbi:MAG TPA: hypothetical protein VGM03_18015, partial [Phycisphaerae bacterium]